MSFSFAGSDQGQVWLGGRVVTGPRRLKHFGRWPQPARVDPLATGFEVRESAFARALDIRVDRSAARRRQQQREQCPSRKVPLENTPQRWREHEEIDRST